MDAIAIRDMLDSFFVFSESNVVIVDCLLIMYSWFIARGTGRRRCQEASATADESVASTVCKQALSERGWCDRETRQ